MAPSGSSAEKTRDHDKIRRWIEERGGKPAVVRGTEDQGEHAGLLRVKFDQSDDDLEPVDWDEFFDTFDESDLTFLYQNQIQGQESRFFKFIRD